MTFDFKDFIDFWSIIMYLSHAYQAKNISVDGEYLNRFFQVSATVLLFLILLYAAERNSALSAEREIRQKQTQITSAEEDLSKLEIKAAKLESAQSIKSSALSENMVPSKGIHFVSVDDLAVSMK